MNEYLNPWYILAETEASRQVIMMHFGNGYMENYYIVTSGATCRLCNYNTNPGRTKTHLGVS